MEPRPRAAVAVVRRWQRRWWRRRLRRWPWRGWRRRWPRRRRFPQPLWLRARAAVVAAAVAVAATVVVVAAATAAIAAVIDPLTIHKAGLHAGALFFMLEGGCRCLRGRPCSRRSNQGWAAGAAALAATPICQGMTR